MKNDSTITPKKKRNMINVRIVFSSIIFTIILMTEIYIMMNQSDQYILLGGFGVILVLSLYFVITSILQKIYEIECLHNEHYEEIFKSEKASYLILRKSFDTIEQRLDDLEKSAVIPTENIINAQKAIAKVSINRSKENAEALMNSNDQLIEKIDGFYNCLNGNNDDLIEKQKQLLEQNNKELLLKQQELLTTIADLEARIRGDIIQGMEKTPINVNIPPIETVVKTVESPTVEKSVPVVEKEPEVTVKQVVEPIVEPEPVAEVEPIEPEEELPPMPDMSDPNKMMSPDEIAAMIANMNASESAEEAPAEAESVEESVQAEEEPVEESVQAEEEAVTEEPKEELPPMPDMSDPNKIMSPDEIAAMIANMNASESVEEAPTEEETVTEEPKEELPPMPDMSDPNKIMSPDEIAAMIANMNASENAEETVEEKPPMPDLSDPNKMMSPDEIAALIANM